VIAQSKKWDVENHFLEFGQALDTLDLITDGLADDPKISNALGAIHKTLIGQNKHLCLEESRLEIKGKREFLGISGMEAFWRHRT